MSADPRSRAQRRRDTEHRFTHDIRVWVVRDCALPLGNLVRIQGR